MVTREQTDANIDIINYVGVIWLPRKHTLTGI